MLAQCVSVVDGSSTDVLPSPDDIMLTGAHPQGVAVFGRCGSIRVSKLLTSITRKIEITLFISSDDVGCGHNLLNISDLTTAFARFRISTVHIVFEREDFQSRNLGMWARDIGMLLNRYIATLEAIVKHDITIRVILHADVTISQPYTTTLLCRDPFDMSRDFSDVILSSAYSFANVYRTLHELDYVYNILYVHNI